MKLISYILLTLFLLSSLSAELYFNHQSTIQYSAGDQIALGSGTFIAVRDVPAGIASDDLSYWVNINDLFPGAVHKDTIAYPKDITVRSGESTYNSISDYVPIGTKITNISHWEPTILESPGGAPNFTPGVGVPTNAPPDDPGTGDELLSWLSGISTRGPISLNNAMTGGILIEGNEDKKVVFMAKGYSMFVSDNVENYAEDLKMIIYSWNDSDEKWEYQGEYDDWVDVTNSTTESGAIVENISTIETSKNPEITLLQDEKEVGVVLTLPPGYHAAIVNSKSSLIQEGIVEVYEVKSSNVDSISSLTGISTRGSVSDTNAMTGGILIEGNEDKKVVFMAKGYSMFVSDNVENYAEDLKMVIYSWNDSDEKWEYQGEYDDWVDVTNSTTESGSIVENISTIETSKNPEITLLQDEKEAGVVLTLPPGYHAAIVSSKSSSLQEGIVEAYEVK